MSCSCFATLTQSTRWWQYTIPAGGDGVQRGRDLLLYLYDAIFQFFFKIVENFQYYLFHLIKNTVWSIYTGGYENTAPVSEIKCKLAYDKQARRYQTVLSHV